MTALTCLTIYMGQKLENVKRLRTFKNDYINITSKDVLDKTFHFKSESYQPFRKSNNDLIYVDINLNHPPQILK